MPPTDRKPWTRDELILAVNLYRKIPFGRIHVRNPDIIHLAGVLGRTPGSVSYNLANFASIDPTLERTGAKNVSKLDHAVWDEFFADWISEDYRAKRSHDVTTEKVTISTIHSVKGFDYACVFVLGLDALE